AWWDAGCGGAPPNKPQFRAPGWSAGGAETPISLRGQWESAVGAAHDYSSASVGVATAGGLRAVILCCRAWRFRGVSFPFMIPSTAGAITIALVLKTRDQSTGGTGRRGEPVDRPFRGWSRASISAHVLTVKLGL